MQYYFNLFSFHGQNDLAHCSQTIWWSPQTGSQKRQDPRTSSQCFHAGLPWAQLYRRQWLEGNKGGFGGINSSTVTESYSLLGILR